MKKCPFCAEEIQDEAIKCKHCRSWLEKDVEAPPFVDAKEVEPSELPAEDTAPAESGQEIQIEEVKQKPLNLETPSKRLGKVNPSQKKALLGALALVVLMGLCPPWMYASRTQIIEERDAFGRTPVMGEPLFQESFDGYHWLFLPPQGGSSYGDPGGVDIYTRKAESYGYHIAFDILLLQWFVVVFVAAGLIYYFREPNPSDSEVKEGGV